MPAKLYRNKTANTVLVVPTKARKYRKALYLFNFFLAGLGLTLLSLSVVMLIYSSETFFPDWLFIALFFLGVLVIAIGALGGRGAVVSFRDLENGNQNWWLILLTILVGLLLLIEIVAGVWLIIEYGVITSTDLTSGSDDLASQFEDSIKDELSAQSELWWDWQKTFECCGYDNNTIPSQLATGKFCTTDPTTTADSCKEVLWDTVAAEYIPLGLFVAVFLSIQLVVCISAMCLACIIKAQEPIYSDY